MPQPTTEIVYARLSLAPYNKHFRLDDRKDEIHPRLYEVLNEEFYQNKLTDDLERVHPEIFAQRIAHKLDPLSTRYSEVKDIGAVAKFEVRGQAVNLLDIRFH